MTNTELLEFIKRLLCSKGIYLLVSFHKLLRRADKGKNGLITKEDLADCLGKIKIQLSKKNFDKLFKLFDIENSGNINHQELYKTIVGEMNLFRAEIVEKVFHKLDKDKNGLIDSTDIISLYDSSKHPDVVARKKSAKDILAIFLDIFDMHFSLVVRK